MHEPSRVGKAPPGQEHEGRRERPDHFGVVAVSPEVVGGGFSPDDSIFVSVVFWVVPSGVEIVWVSLIFDSSEQPRRPNVEQTPTIRVVARKRFMEIIL